MTGRLRGSRNRLSEEVICALLRDFREHGEKAIAKVRREQPSVYLKVLALLIPREHKVEHSNAIKDLTDDQLKAMIEYIKTSSLIIPELDHYSEHEERPRFGLTCNGSLIQLNGEQRVDAIDIGKGADSQSAKSRA